MKTPCESSVILVPLSLNENNQTLIETASRLALETGAHLRLLHVIKPVWTKVASERGANDVSEIVENECIRLAQSGLKEMCAHLPEKVKYTKAYTISHSVPEAILKDASEHFAAMILCSTSSFVLTLLPKGISTILSLMAHSPIPVMAVPNHATLGLNDQAWRFMLADDLSDAGLSAAKYCLEWSRSQENSALFHIHVNPLVENAFVSSFVATFRSQNPSINPSIDAQGLYKQYNEALDRKLKDRLVEIGGENAALEGRYKTKLCVGPVTQEVKDAARELAVNAIVFGRHKAVHDKPFGIGATVYSLLLQQQYSIIVVPL